MNITKINGKNRRGLSSIVGGVFFLIIMVTGASYILYSMNQLDTFSQAIISKNQQDRDKVQENFQITSVTLANNKFNVTVQNTGMIPINITRLWVENKTDATWPISKYVVNQIVTPGQTLSKIGQTLPLYAKSTQAYGLTLVTDRGNSEVALVNSASVKPLMIQLFVLPDTVPTGFDTTVLFAVTNNMTNNGGLSNLQPNIKVGSYGATATLVSGPEPPLYPFLSQGDTAYFKYVYSISGTAGQKVNFTASLQNGYLGNSITKNVTVTAVQNTLLNGLKLSMVNKNVGYSVTASDTIINVNATAGGNPTTITLPSANTVTNETFIIKKIDYGTNVIMVKTSGGTIDGFANENMTLAKTMLMVQSNGTGYNTLIYPQMSMDSFRVAGKSLNHWFGSFAVPFTPTTITPSTTAITATPFTIGNPIRIDKIQLEVSTSVAGSTCRMGIYTDNGTGYPQYLVMGSDVGTVSGASTGVQTNTFTTPITLPSGGYWLANQCSTATTIQLRAIPSTAIQNVLGVLSTMGITATGTGWQATFSYATFPHVFPTVGSTVITSNVPEILIRQIG
ncbi:MAG TPA: hypothetical protein VEJ68_06045 [Candidatus Bathyarchaeia archaeon]|nr:hypothetical protein [Candidatus Bathyarchaeia archaeon]